MKLSFRQKAIFFLCSIVVGISIVYTVAAIFTERRLLQAEIVKRGELLAAVAAKNAELPILSENIQLLKNASGALRATSDVPFVAFYTKTLVSLVHDGPILPENTHPGLNPEVGVITVEHSDCFEFYAPVFTTRIKEDIEIFQVEESSHPIKELIGWARIGLSKEVIKNTERNIVTRGVVFGITFALLAVGLVYTLLNIFTKPLSALFSAVKGLKQGEYLEIQDVLSTDEIGQLSLEFNRMTQAIKDREHDLLESERRIKKLFERVDHAIFRLDPDLLVAVANKKFNELCPGKKNFFTLFPDEDEDKLLDQIVNGGLINVEKKIVDADGNESVIVISVYPEQDDRNNIIGFDGYFVDVTEKKRLEASLIQAQKMESLGLLAGGIAHDFNNILTGILGYSSLLKRVMPETDKHYRYLDPIEKSASRAASLTKQLLGFARKGKYNPVEIDFNKLVTEILAFLKETLDRSISVRVSLSEEVLLVLGDSSQLYQVMLNLCLNARDAMPGGGILFMTTEYCEILNDKPIDNFKIPAGSYIRVRVTDTGMGMPSGVMKRIFEPFFTTKGTGKGTGLGLAMVYGIVKNHGGYVTVFSEPGLGATFHLYLPAIKVIRPARAMAERPGRGTILFVHDEEKGKAVYQDILQGLDYTVLMAAGADKGEKILNSSGCPVDLVILNIENTESAARRIISAIKNTGSLGRMLVLAGHGPDDDLIALLGSEGACFLLKPFDYRKLAAQVEELTASAAVGH